MRPVSAISSSFRTHLGLERRRAPRAEAAQPEDRALVTVRPVPRAETHGYHRPSVAFLAHLIATRDQAPQTRERRRGEPAEAVLAYGSATPRLLPSPTVIGEM